MNSEQEKENGEDLRLRIVLPLGGGGTRKRTATITVMALTAGEQKRVDAEVRSLLAGWAREAISEKGGRNGVQY